MKTKRLLFSLLALLASIGANAYTYNDYDFKYNGIYYDITSSTDKTVAVTYQSFVYTEDEGSVPSGYYYKYDDESETYDYYTSDYSGNISIPSTVYYNGTTYQVTSIRDYAFNNCNATSITIPSNITKMGWYVFRGYRGALTINCQQLSFQVAHSDEGYTWYTTIYPFREGDFTSLTLGSNVTSIPNYTFEGCKGITSLILPCLTSIGNSAFYGCSNLAVIDINASNLTSIGDYAFSNCPNLKTVNLNSIASWLNCTLGNASSSPFYNGADLYVADEEKTTISFPVASTNIPAYAFYGCSNITSVSIPAQVNTIGAEAFARCPSLTAINVNANNSNYKSENGILYNSDKSTLMLCPAKKSGTITIPQTVTTISPSAFYGCSDITSLTLPSSLTSIGSSAFSGCSGTLTVNCNVPSVSYYTNSPFYGSSFYKIIFGNNVTSIGSYAFSRCSGITSLTLPSSLTSIGFSTFSYCSGITTLTLPSSLTSISESAFSGCSGIATVTIPNTLATSVGTGAFSGCSNIATVNTKISDISSISSNRTIYSFLPVSAIWNYYLNDNLLTALEIPSSVTSIGDNAFYNAKGITSLTLPSSLTSIGGSAFYGCSGITNLTLPSALTSIGSSAFSGCSGITTVTIPNTLATSVGTNAFSGSSNIATVNTKISDISSISSNRTIYSFLPISATWNYYLNDNLLTVLEIPSSVTSIGDNAFYNAKGLTSLTLPSTLTSIGSSAFYGCSGITSLTLPSSLTNIGSSAFFGCSGTLTVNCNIPNASPFNGCTFNKIVLGSNVSSIGNSAFSGCNATAFICQATTPPTLGSNNAFGGKKKIYVPYRSMAAYRSAWSQLSTPTYTYLPLLDVMFFEQQTATSYAAELSNKNKSLVTSVAFYEGGLDGTLTESKLKAGMNPNCLYYVPASAGLSGDNIITLDSYQAEKVSLTDNYDFDCPIPFHTDEIEYVHHPSVWANGSAGWETICLPFAPESFEASERGYIAPIMLGSTGNFWLRKFVGASSDAVYFSSTIDGQMESNTPYLVAFPGSSMGAGHLQGQTITFRGHNANIQVSEQPEVKKNDYIFVGNYNTTTDGVEGWALNAAGSSFIRNNNVGNQPFRAYFKNSAGQTSNARLNISFDDPTDVRSLRATASDIVLKAVGNGALLIESEACRPLSVYTIDGRQVRRVQLTVGENRIDGLHKGLYLIDNQKVMLR